MIVVRRIISYLPEIPEYWPGTLSQDDTITILLFSIK